MSTGSTDYQPGVCNIGAAQRRKRRLTGVLGLIGAGAFVAAVVALGLPDRVALGAFAFFFPAALGLLQARLQFCVGFAALARYEVSEDGDDLETVAEQDALRVDRRRALEILVYSLVAAGVATAGAYLFVALL